ncbi:6,7-dimethyl-8-ribityllumazine synthase [Leucobacter sp. UCMA 4100]|uniref:6,7-dimethyl-8-ribityllumazine synthase n=1 Tax=Leucobacter TaxID=55968 RepID=UPI001C220467|nr:MULTISPECIES: 6,7-dimethyl-8-ribityllumazine synthase [Leucobacter]MDA3146790.1 6,7-dimethyl-8-ribityllumazine synthase [Leucobacter sp. UCMA 4100]
MAGSGAPSLAIEAEGLRVAVLAGSWHEEIMNGLIEGACSTLQSAGAEFELHRVAGAFELPVAAQAALAGEFDAVVCLGVIVRGGTPHFDYVCNAVTDGLTRVALDTGKAVGFGVLTVDTDEQAFQRSGLPGSQESKGQEAAEAALNTALLVSQLRG